MTHAGAIMAKEAACGRRIVPREQLRVMAIDDLPHAPLVEQDSRDPHRRASSRTETTLATGTR